MKTDYRRIRSLTLAAILASLLTSSIFGAGFALQEHSISGLGVGFASGAAGGTDNSSMFFNPATLTLVKGQQITSGIHFIMPEAEFNNEGSRSAYVSGVSPGVLTQGPNATSDKSALVPNLTFSRPLGEKAYIGFDLSAPYGLATSYDKGWVGRYIALETDLQTINSNLAFAYEISPSVSIGFGINVLYGDAILSNAINFGAGYLRALNGGVIPQNPETLALAQDVQANLGGTKYDGSLKLEGDDWGYGFNVGILFHPNEATRIGLHYRSSVKLELEGRANFDTGALSTFFANSFPVQGGAVDLELPDTAQVSVHYQMNPRWAVMADLFHTWWEKFDQLNIRYETGNPANSVIPENWQNVWRYSVGTTYEISDSLQLRAGLVYDESPVTSNLYRSPRIPDQDRLWIALGVGYTISENLRLDAGYVHIFVNDPVIDNPTHTSGEYLKGTINATTDIISIGGSLFF